MRLNQFQKSHSGFFYCVKILFFHDLTKPFQRFSPLCPGPQRQDRLDLTRRVKANRPRERCLYFSWRRRPCAPKGRGTSGRDAVSRKSPEKVAGFLPESARTLLGIPTGPLRRTGKGRRNKIFIIFVTLFFDFSKNFPYFAARIK